MNRTRRTDRTNKGHFSAGTSGAQPPKTPLGHPSVARHRLPPPRAGLPAASAHEGWAPSNSRQVASLPRCTCGGSPCSGSDPVGLPSLCAAPPWCTPICPLQGAPKSNEPALRFGSLRAVKSLRSSAAGFSPAGFRSGLAAPARLNTPPAVPAARHLPGQEGTSIVVRQNPSRPRPMGGSASLDGTCRTSS
jgi:hypothetical protein